MTAPRKKKLQIAAIISMSLGSVLGIVVEVIRSYRAKAFIAGHLDKDVWGGEDLMFDFLLGLAVLVFVAGSVAFLAGRLAKVERV